MVAYFMLFNIKLFKIMTGKNIMTLLDNEISAINNKKQGNNVTLTISLTNGSKIMLKHNNVDCRFKGPEYIAGSLKFAEDIDVMTSEILQDDNFGCLVNVIHHSTIRYIPIANILDICYTFEEQKVITTLGVTKINLSDLKYQVMGVDREYCRLVINGQLTNVSFVLSKASASVNSSLEDWFCRPSVYSLVKIIDIATNNSAWIQFVILPSMPNPGLIRPLEQILQDVPVRKSYSSNKAEALGFM